MKIQLFLSVCLLTFVLVVSADNPVSDAEIYIEKVKDGEQIAFRKTGNGGAVTFNQLDKGSYNIIVVLPAQKGKLAHGRKKMNLDLNVGYHSDKKLYFINEMQGNFVISFSGIKKIANSDITPMYEVIKNRKDDPRIVVGKFEVDGKSGSFTIKIEALSDKGFKKSVEKYRDDTSMATIVGRK